MLLFRNKFVKQLLASIAGLVFLNMSFFMAELNVLDFKKNNRPLYDLLVETFSSICEEEKDSFGAEGAENENTGKELDVELSFVETQYNGYTSTIMRGNSESVHHPCNGTSWSVNQPPEQA